MSRAGAPRYRREHGRERLIPVRAAAAPAPTADEIRCAAADLVVNLPALHEELRRDPGRIAELDQLHAAEKRLSSQLRRFRYPKGWTRNEVRDQEAQAAARIALLIAVLRNVEARCQHVDWPPTAHSPRTVVSLTARGAVCGRPGCVAALGARWHDDGRCELCERPSDEFRAVVAALGPCIVTLELCDECVGLLGYREPEAQAA